MRANSCLRAGTSATCSLIFASASANTSPDFGSYENEAVFDNYFLVRCGD